MKRRIWILALVLALALSALPVSAGATADDAKDELYKRTRKSYASSLASYGKSSFHGYCATLVAYQLRYAGITKKTELCNGNEMYDRYKNKKLSSGGYYIHPYSAKSYSLEEALNAISLNGTKDVYDILVGFQWTNTAAGRKYGHTVFINGILDGVVYFTESFDSATIGDEGTVGRLSISKFADMYNSWTRFEGCIHFTKDYAASLQQWPTDLFVRVLTPDALCSQPSPVGVEKSTLMRSVHTGERLHVTGVLQDDAGQWYYAVLEDGYTGYLPAQAAEPIMANAENVGIRTLQLAQSVQPEQALALAGTAWSAYGSFHTVEAVVMSASGEEVARVEKTAGSRTFELEKLALPVLPVGGYTLTVTAEVNTPYVNEDRLEECVVEAQLLSEPFWVGPMSRTDHVRAVPAMTRAIEGWSRQNGTWYYYENGAAYTGWLWEDGVRYYLNESGAVTTGWAVIDGQTCLFSANGALCTGWILDTQGLRYCSDEGRFANGWMNIDGSRYYFEQGILQTEGIVTDGVEVYQLQPDGKATVLTEE